MVNEGACRISDELTLEDSPLKWVISLGDLPEEGRHGEKIANPDELVLLTKMLDDDPDISVLALRCTYRAKAEKALPSGLVAGDRGEVYRVSFMLKARLRQVCVVTLEPVETSIEEEFSQLYASPGYGSEKQKSTLPDPEDPFCEDPPLALIGGQAEIGPLVCQYLSMSIDPNPRREGAVFPTEEGREEGAGHSASSPFSVLENYRPKKQK